MGDWVLILRGGAHERHEPHEKNRGTPGLRFSGGAFVVFVCFVGNLVLSGNVALAGVSFGGFLFFYGPQGGNELSALGFRARTRPADLAPRR